MKRLLTLFPWLLSGLLCACGGGAGSAAPPTANTTPSSPVTCSLGMQYADGSASGMAIAPQARSVDRFLNNCPIAQLQSLSLTVCVDHPSQQEITGQLWLSRSALLQFQLADGVQTGARCLATATAGTALREFSLNMPTTAGLNPASGPWSVGLQDTLTNNQNGYLVAWALELRGWP